MASIQSQLKELFPANVKKQKLNVEHRHGMPEVFIYTPTSVYNLSQDIRHYTFNRNQNQLTGNWTVTLRFRYLTKQDIGSNDAVQQLTWLDIIKEFNFIDISMRTWEQQNSAKNTKKYTDVEPKYVLSGIVRRIRQKKTMSNKTVQADIVISGTTFGGLLNAAQIFFHPNMPETGAVLGASIYSKLLQYSGTADKMIQNLIETFIYGKPNGTPPVNGIDFLGKTDVFSKKEWFDIHSKVRPGQLFANTITAEILLNLMETKTIEQCMDPMIEKPFIECFTETNTKTGTEELHLRPAPFSYENFRLATNDKYCVTINAEDIDDEEIMVGDDEAYNLFFCTPANYDSMGSDITLNTRPIFINNKWIAKMREMFPLSMRSKYASADVYGIRQMNIYSRYIKIYDTDLTPETKGQKVTDVAGRTNTLQVMMAEWFVMNHIFRRGTLKIKGKPEIKIGKYLKVNDPRAGMQYIYYIVGKTETWTYEGAYQQTLLVIRGLPYFIQMDGKTVTYDVLAEEIRKEVQIMLTRVEAQQMQINHATQSVYEDKTTEANIDNTMFKNMILNEEQLIY